MTSRIPFASSGRRSFLVRVGLWGSALAGVSAFGRPAPAPAAAAGFRAEGRIGLLLPSPTVCRGRDTSLVAGFQLALDQAREQGGDIRLELVHATTRLSPLAYRKAAESLLVNDAADLVIALAQPALASAMAPAFEAASRCLLVVDGGANLVRAEEKSSHVFYNTLGQWESAWALGQWAARSFPGDGFMVVSAFEAGHDSLRAFRLGVLSGGSGEKGFLVPRMPLHEATNGLSPAAYVDLIQRTGPAYVVALLGGVEGLEFLRAFQLAGLAGQIPLIGSAVLAEDALAAGLGENLANFTTASGWSSALATPGSRAFLAEYRRSAGREADAFAALGYDTGRMLLAALQDGGGHARFAREALERAAWDGPGGKRAIDFASHTVQGDVHFIHYDGSRPSVLRSERGVANHAQEVDEILRSRRASLVNPYPVY